jgi:para-aminobenzoate synthetase/4-amino-4-deoxychorismate lyase
MRFQPLTNEVVLYDPSRRVWLHFHQPERILVAYQVDEVLAGLQEIEKLVDLQHKFAAGFIAYEAAPAFDRAFQVNSSQNERFPLLWFGIYPQPSEQTEDAMIIGQDWAGINNDSIVWQADISEDTYQEAIGQIKAAIARGDTYQVNYTYRLRARWTAPAWPAFAALASAHTPPYAAFIETDDWAICSTSPELFFRLEGEILTSRPMKGTAQRGLQLEDDRQAARWLQRSSKNRAENVMIVDMVRNDLGRIARTGSVRVPKLFQVEKYPTVWQMTSTVQADSQASLVDIFKALFPPASITGAPKVRTMQIIADLEKSPRRIYTGAIGYYSPGRQAQFNVAIRTLRIDRLNDQAEYGVGGGIVWDSQPQAEWEETQTKARILYEKPQSFELIETLRWTDQAGWSLLDLHLKRMKRSASYFAFPLNLVSLRKSLIALPAKFQAQAQRVRLRLSNNGKLAFEYQPIDDRPPSQRVGLARTPVRSNDRFLYHKTTRRDVYERARQERLDCDEVLLWNERGELTEATIANLVVELQGKLYTPPVACGLLPGVYRAWLLANGQVNERVIRVAELQDSSRIWLANSIRGMWQVVLMG